MHIASLVVRAVWCTLAFKFVCGEIVTLFLQTAVRMLFFIFHLHLAQLSFADIVVVLYLKKIPPSIIERLKCGSKDCSQDRLVAIFTPVACLEYFCFLTERKRVKVVHTPENLVCICVHANIVLVFLGLRDARFWDSLQRSDLAQALININFFHVYATISIFKTLRTDILEL